MNDEEFEKTLRLGFLDEADQIASNMEQHFLDLSEHEFSDDLMNAIFRCAHNLKGSARAVGFSDLAQFVHEIESAFLFFNEKKIVLSENDKDAFFESIDKIKKSCEIYRSDFSAAFDFTTASKRLSSIDRKKSSDQSNLIKNKETTNGFAIFEDDDQSVLSSKPVAQNKSSQDNKPDMYIRVDLSRVEKLINYVGELVILHDVLREQESVTGNQLSKKTFSQLKKVTKEVQDLSMGLRMVPIRPVFQKMQRIVRDIAKELEKDVQLNLEGSQMELDRAVLEKISDPLVHLVRNAIDHGIEKKEEREKKNKSSQASITLKASQQGGKFVIEVVDDGKGIDHEVVYKAAIKKGIINQDAHLSIEEKLNLIFKASFSTKDTVTDISGRGVGMDVVANCVNELSGSVKIQTKIDQGTTIRLSLPQSLAIIAGMIVTVNGSKFVFPITQVYESVKIDEKKTKITSTLGEILLLRGENLPLYRLSLLLNQKPQAELKKQIAIVVRSTKAYCICVDEIVGQAEIVVKQLGREIQNLPGVVGSTILGDGNPALILDADLLIDRVMNHANYYEMLRKVV